MKKYPGGLIFVRFGWSYEGFMPIFDELLGYAYSSGFKPFSIKSAFEPITPPLKWVLADAACKVSIIFFQYRVGFVLGDSQWCKVSDFYLSFWIFATSIKILWV